MIKILIFVVCNSGAETCLYVWSYDPNDGILNMKKMSRKISKSLI